MMKLNKSAIVRAYLDKHFPKWEKTGKTAAMGTYQEIADRISASAVCRRNRTVIQIPDIANQFWSHATRVRKGGPKYYTKSESNSECRSDSGDVSEATGFVLNWAQLLPVMSDEQFSDLCKQVDAERSERFAAALRRKAA